MKYVPYVLLFLVLVLSRKTSEIQETIQEPIIETNLLDTIEMSGTYDVTFVGVDSIYADIFSMWADVNDLQILKLPHDNCSKCPCRTLNK